MDQLDALYDAAIAGDAEAIAKLKMEADKLDRYGRTILHNESRKGNAERVRLILREFSNKNLLVKLGNQKETALIWAACMGHPEVIEILIEAARHLPPSANDNPITSFQAFLRHADKYLETALHAAVTEGRLDVVKLLVEADPTDTHTQNNEGKTPLYIAAEKGYMDIVKVICTTCTAVPLNLKGPGGRETALHAIIKNFDEAKNEVRDTFKIISKPIISKNPDLIYQADEYGQTILELAMERNYIEVVELILDVLQWTGKNVISVVPLIYKAKDNEHENMVKVLSEWYDDQAATLLHFTIGDQVSLISAIRRRETETVFSLLDNNAESLVTFVDNLGWTSLHHAVYHEFDSITKPIVEAQKKYGHEFLYLDKASTPFHVGAEKGYTSTVILLMQLWPSSSSAYTAIDKNGQNILHLAALQSKKEMIQDILKYCGEEYKNEFVNKQDNNGDTPLHLLIKRGCLVPELLRYEGLDTMVENNNRCTPPDMLYVENQIIDDQVKLKVALDHIQIDRKRDIFSSSVLSTSKRERKNVNFKEKAQKMTDEKLAWMKEDTRAVANCFADAIAGDPISRAALEIKANTLNEAGETILHVESKKGVEKNVRFIMKAFANQNLLVRLDNQKQTALYLAAHHGHTQVVEALLDAARRNLPSSLANDDTQNPVTPFQAYIRQANVPNQNTALHQAVLYGNVAIVKLLVEADPNDSHLKNNEGKTPIYIAAENGFQDVVKEICATCTALSLDGPGGRTTALHALIQNIGQMTEGASNVIGMMVVAAKRWSTSAEFEVLFSKIDESERTVLQLAMERNNVDAVRLMLQEDPAYQHGHEIKRSGLMRLIYKATDKGYSDDIVKLLSQTYQVGIRPEHKDVLSLILAIKRRDEDSVLRLLEGAKDLVSFTEDNGWTALHYAVYHEFDSVLGAIIGAQEDVKHQFVYDVPTPFHVAVECGYTSTLVRLMQLWPALSSASEGDKSPYIVVNKDGRNILHLAAAYNSITKADNRKEMVEGILRYCPQMYKDQILKQKDINGDTPLHVLISQGCFIPELIKAEGLDTMTRNNNNFTPWEMLYLKNDVVADQVHIKIAIDDIQSNQSAWNLCNKRKENKKDIWKNIPPSKRRTKDVIFDESKKLLMDAEHVKKKEKLKVYKSRTNTQIIVTALITTVTFTVGFTMPGGLHQSGEVDEGLVLLSKKTAFNAFMVSDALALLLSTSSLFFYFLESMTENPHQVSKLNAASTVLNIISVMAMMLTFIAGTYLVLSHSAALAITVCIIGSLFFLLIIFLLIKIVYDRLQGKRNLD